jgi:isoamylase
MDLVSYTKKRNLANGELNRDGSDAHGNMNYGVEGPALDREVQELRRRHVQSLLGAMCFSLGTPMLCMGDEFGRTQGGNSNAYCQDNDVSYMQWELADQRIYACVAAMLQLRQHIEVFARASFLDPTTVVWRRADGLPMRDTDWQTQASATLIAEFPGEHATHVCIFHGGARAIAIELGGNCTLLIDTAERSREGFRGSKIEVHGTSISVLRRV